MGMALKTIALVAEGRELGETASEEVIEIPAAMEGELERTFHHLLVSGDVMHTALNWHLTHLTNINCKILLIIRYALTPYSCYSTWLKKLTRETSLLKRREKWKAEFQLFQEQQNFFHSLNIPEITDKTRSYVAVRQ